MGLNLAKNGRNEGKFLKLQLALFIQEPKTGIIFCGTLCGISPDIFSDILSGILSGISSEILSDIFFFPLRSGSAPLRSGSRG